MLKLNPADFADLTSMLSASPFHFYRTNKEFENCYSNIRVVHSIIQLDDKRLSYKLVCLNCNKLVITCPLRRLANLRYHPHGIVITIT